MSILNYDSWNEDYSRGNNDSWGNNNPHNDNWGNNNRDMNNNRNHSQNVHQPHGGQKKIVCRHWSKGFCKEAANCPFSHPTNTQSVGMMNSFTMNNNRGSFNPGFSGVHNGMMGGQGNVCRHFQKGFCHLGNACIFAHTSINGGLMNGAMHGAMNGINRPHDNRCRHWAKGNCVQGNDCKFSHEGPQKEKREKTQEKDGEDSGSKMCRHFESKGMCMLGYACHFSHVPENHRSQDTCRHWLKGVCRLGVHCKFKHTPVDGNKQDDGNNNNNNNNVNNINNNTGMNMGNDESQLQMDNLNQDHDDNNI